MKFVIDASGSVSTIGDDGSDLKDKDVVSCIMKRVSALGFPQPESGIVTVKYPLILAPRRPSHERRRGRETRRVSSPRGLSFDVTRTSDGDVTYPITLSPPAAP